MATTKTPDTKDALRILAAVAPPIDLSSVPMPSDQTIACIAREVGFTVSKDIRVKAAELQTAFETAQANQIAHNTDAARKAHWAQHEALDADVALGKNVTVRDSFSLEDFAEDYREKCRAYREECFRLSQKAHALSVPLIEGFCAKANALDDKLEASEIEIADRFAVRHVPSDAVLAIRKLADHILKSARDFYPKSGASPRSLFSHLISFEPSEK